MPDDIGGVFDGGGSVRWTVVTAEDDGSQSESYFDDNERSRRTNAGVDKRQGRQFVMILKVPEDGSAAKFLAQFKVKPKTVKESDGTQYKVIELYLNRENRQKQIRVEWPDEKSVTSV